MLPRKDLFDLPDGVIYLNGNSLGPLPKGCAERAGAVIREEWGGELIRAWNSREWMGLPTRVGDRIGTLIGAAPGTVVAGDTLTIKVFQALSAALAMRPGRRVILSDNGNFPTDLYMAEGLVALLKGTHELRVVDPEDIPGAITDEVAVVMLTEVDYRTGRRHDMPSVTKAAHDAGAVMLWDLAHSAGAFPVDIAGSGAEFAVGCTYKYLNGGPGAPAFIYVRPDLIGDTLPSLAGWLGHDAPFAFELGYRAAPGIERLRVGTPPVIQMSVLETALKVWDEVDLTELRAASVALCELFIAEVEARCPGLTLASPRDAAVRGSQVTFSFPEGYALMQALIAHGVIGDFRAPDIMRFGFTPLYIDEGDVRGAVDVIELVIRDRLWDAPEFRRKNQVT